MKKTLILLTISLLFLGCAHDYYEMPDGTTKLAYTAPVDGAVVEKAFAAWLYGDAEVLGARLGARLTENNEIGVLAEIYPNTRDQDSEVYGLYGVYHFDDTVKFTNPFNQNELIEGQPYIGVQTSFGDKFNDQFSPFTGFTFNLSNKSKKEDGGLFIEYAYDSFDNRSANDEHILRLGMRIKF